MADDNAALHGLVADATQRMTREAADRIAARARQNAPVRTGHLRDSIHVEEIEGGHAVVVDADYWAPVEFGHHEVAWGHDTHREVPAQPFLRPALAESEEQR